MGERLKVLFLSPEAVPFAKTGGLADVAGSLPVALRNLEADARMVLPLYRVVREGDFETRSLFQGVELSLAGHPLKAGVREAVSGDELPVYFIEREDMFDRPNLYGNSAGDYYDNLERFAFYVSAALRIAELLDFKPDLIHCHDWQTGLVPALLRGPLRDHAFWGKTPVVFTIHNLGYQGLFPADKLPVTGLPRDGFFHPGGLEYWGNISLLKAGIVYSAAVTTVSPTYAREIQGPDHGMGMDGILRDRSASVHGILNGVDYQFWDPSRDRHLPVHYSPDSMAGKKRCKEFLIHRMNLDSALRERPLLGMVSRLDNQKGLDLLMPILDEIPSLGAGLVVLGSGDEKIQQAIKEASHRHRGHIALGTGFNEPLAHQIMAGADILLIPSRYEPCGLTQMYALKYGTVPVVRATGGLDDTIVSFDLERSEGNGFKFGPYEVGEFRQVIRGAIDLFQQGKVWKQLVANGMKADFSWVRSARRYMELYRSVVGL